MLLPSPPAHSAFVSRAPAQRSSALRGLSSCECSRSLAHRRLNAFLLGKRHSSRIELASFGCASARGEGQHPVHPVRPRTLRAQHVSVSHRRAVSAPSRRGGAFCACPVLHKRSCSVEPARVHGCQSWRLQLCLGKSRARESAGGSGRVHSAANTQLRLLAMSKALRQSAVCAA
jgi:hypothetical protein